MDSPIKTQSHRSLQAAAWKPVGAGIVVTLMVLVHSASIQSVAPQRLQRTATEQCLRLLNADAEFPAHRAVRLKLSLSNLRDDSGNLTSNGESFFLLLARRMKPLSLSVMLTISSSADTEFAAAIAARMMQETPLESTQLCLGMEEQRVGDNMRPDPVLTITITRQESPTGDRE